MAVKDTVITLKGDQAVVRKIEIVKRTDGSFNVVVYGETKTASGTTVGLDLGQVDRPASNSTLSNMWNLALPILRIANGLED